ncbi:MAG: DUF1223 domain-containing protein [Candidatus Competibacteraceae bacterium]|nr:DUF1223 domain-containing protein [Candidatus Competibacteraceae bacterium]
MNARTRAATLLALLMGGYPAMTQAAGCTATSAPHRTALVELYTSEGCNSCPPADRWLSHQTTQMWDPRHVTALAFHVDYWDRLGWKDRFAQPAFSARQRALVAQQGSRTVYTPHIMVNGQTLTSWRQPTAFAQRIADLNAQPAPADLHVELFAGLAQWRVQTTGRMRAPTAANTVGVFVAVYQDRLSSRVTAGENAGERLRHDRVVRALEGPLRIEDDGHFIHSVAFRLPSEFIARNAGVVVFLQQIPVGDVVQALARPACSS